MTIQSNSLLLLATICILSACQSPDSGPVILTVDKLDSEFNKVVAPGATMQVIADGFEWCEGPVWVESHKMLLFSDIPRNRIYKWTKEKGSEVYLEPSGYTGAEDRGGETGSNGLTLDSSGNLVLCQHGDRRIARMNAPVDQPRAEFVTLADNYNSKRFDSPNDLVYDNKGSVYFTDPPYGLEKNASDPAKQAPYQGVYRITNGVTYLLTDSITRPNGIGFTPDFKTLIVANSDPDKPFWYAYDIGPGDSLVNARVFFDARNAPFSEKGAPDGFKIDKSGYLFSSGPGGIWIFSPSGKLLGRIRVYGAISNCAFSADEKILFITADDDVLKVNLR